MGSSYKPYPVYDLKTGIKLDRAPWLLPQDAFSSLENCFLFEGKIRKRRGYQELFRIVHGVEEELIGTGDGIETTFSGTLEHFPVRRGDITFTDGTETFTHTDQNWWMDGWWDNDWWNDQLTPDLIYGDFDGTGIVDLETGEFSITFNTAPGEEVEILVSYDYYPDLPTMGIFNYTTASGTEQLLVFNTKRLNYYDDINEKLVDPTKEDIFSGEDFNFFWLSNWNGIAYVCNGHNRVKTWDGSTLADLLIDIDGDSDNDVTYAMYAFPYKSRLVLLRIEDVGFGQYQRARWSKVGTTDFSNDEFVDAPVNDWIISAGFLRDELIVWFERSVWALRYTGSDRLPFRWVRLASQEGSVAPMSLSEFPDKQLILGNVSIISFDGRDVFNIAKKLSNYILNFNQSKLKYCYSGVAEEYKQAWFTYPSIDSDLCDKLLCYNYEDNNWASFSLAMHSLGYFSETDSPTWDDMNMTWDEMEEMWDIRDFQAGFPRMIGGDYEGYIYKMEYGGSDNGEDINAEILTGRWNPFLNNGLSCRLGYVDFLVERNDAISFRIDFYIDNELATPANTQYVTLAGDKGTETGELVFVRADCGLEAKFIQMKVTNEGQNQTFVIHAIIPYFKQAGRIR